MSIELRTGDAYALPLPDASFDVVHAHQLLQHLSGPVRALAEMRRVRRPGGLLGARDGDYACCAWAPVDPLPTRGEHLDNLSTRPAPGDALQPHALQHVRAVRMGLDTSRMCKSISAAPNPESDARRGR